MAGGFAARCKTRGPEPGCLVQGMNQTAEDRFRQQSELRRWNFWGCGELVL